MAEGVLGLRAAARVPATLREIGEAVRLARYTVSCHLSITEEDGRLLRGEDRGTRGASAEIGPAKPHRLMAISKAFVLVCSQDVEHRFAFLCFWLLASN